MEVTPEISLTPTAVVTGDQHKPEDDQKNREEEKIDQMLHNTSSDLMTRSPPLDPDGDARRKRRDRFRRLVNVEEVKRQILFSLPMIVTNVLYYCIPVVSVMFAGHVGRLELAGSTLGNSWASVSGFTFMTGLSGALETLCGQGFGAKMYETLGTHLQSACTVSFFFSVIISVFWLYTEPVLIFLHQEPLISQHAAVYIKYLIPGLFAYGFLQNILRFLQTQSVLIPQVLFSVASMVIHVGVVYALVRWTALGFRGAALGASISLWISVIFLGIYVTCSKKFKRTWSGFSLESFRCIPTNLKLSLPSAAMVCLEYWAFEILVILAGLMPDAEITTSLVAMCVNTDMIGYMLAYGLSAAASTRVSNELGAGNPKGAKKAMFVSLELTLVLALTVVFALVLGRNTWAGFFSDNPLIIKKFSAMTPFVATSILLDSFQGTLSGVARGCGWQALAVCVNLAMFYFVGTPIGALLGFKLHLYAKGLWIGLICGLFCQATCLLLITLCRKWKRLDLPAPEDQETRSNSAN